MDCVRDRLALYAGELRPQSRSQQEKQAQKPLSGAASAFDDLASATLLARWCGPWLPRDYALPPNTAATLVFTSGKLGTPGFGGSSLRRIASERGWGEPSDWIAYVGKYYLVEEEATQQLRYVDAIFIHPGYQMEVKTLLVENRKDHDIALIKLNAPVTLNGQVQPICLEELQDLADNTTCYVTGWGATREAEMSPVLKQAAVLVLPLDDCAAYYNGTCVINNLMYCAGYEDGRHDSCHGDSGGPLVVKQAGRWQLAGVISGGLRCGEPRHPGIYTKMTPHYAWIRDVIAGNATRSH
ncbi:hypothetical protein V5799_003794 [Amblyomma americanum]|uniref:Peptidase S1 domain-containing protein n=1 Tax=Amblyomma americanum TaxID=6943 RepID=A0AAQ4D7Y4_AMBAM